MDEVLMVPVKEFNRLSNYYQGKITESALINKAGQLAAEQQLILDDKSIPDSLAVQMVKAMALEQGCLVKRVRTGTAQLTTCEGIKEPEGMVDAPIKRLDRIAKQHDIDYSRAKNLQGKWVADTKMIQAINKLPGKKTLTERMIRKIMQAKKRMKL